MPGRIEVFGKHTDYAGGASMVVAVEQGFCLVVGPARRPPGDRRRRAAATRRSSSHLDAELTPAGRPLVELPDDRRPPHRPQLPRRRSAGPTSRLASDLPPAAGMSSSSAMIVAMFLALAEVNELDDRPEFRENVHDPVELAGYLATVENGQTFGSLDGDRGVGTFGGSEDHTAILNCRAGHLSEYAYCPVRFERTVPMPAGYTFAIGASGVVAEKTGAAMEKYNRASGLAFRGGRAVARGDRPRRPAPGRRAGQRSGGRRAAHRRGPLGRARTRSETEALLARLEHFITENEQLLPATGRRAGPGRPGRAGPVWSTVRRSWPRSSSATRCRRRSAWRRWRGELRRGGRARRSGPVSAAACGRWSRSPGPGRFWPPGRRPTRGVSRDRPNAAGSSSPGAGPAAVQVC